MNLPRDKDGYYNNISIVLDLIGNKKKQEIKVPVELCFYVIRNKMMPTFKVYILLKMTCSGITRLTPSYRTYFAEFCGYRHVRLFNKHIERLKDLNWIGYNQDSGVYHIRGFDYLQIKFNLKSRTGFWFRIQDMVVFDAVIGAAVIGYLVKSQGKKQRMDLKRGRSNQVLCKTPGFFPVSNIALGKILNISTSTASILKKRAEHEGYVTILRKRIIEPATYDSYNKLCQQYPPEILKGFIWKGKFYQRFPDFIKPHLKYGTRKKIDR